MNMCVDCSYKGIDIMNAYLNEDVLNDESCESEIESTDNHLSISSGDESNMTLNSYFELVMDNNYEGIDLEDDNAYVVVNDMFRKHMNTMSNQFDFQDLALVTMDYKFTDTTNEESQESYNMQLERYEEII